MHKSEDETSTLTVVFLFLVSYFNPIFIAYLHNYRITADTYKSFFRTIRIFNLLKYIHLECQCKTLTYMEVISILIRQIKIIHQRCLLKTVLKCSQYRTSVLKISNILYLFWLSQNVLLCSELLTAAGSPNDFHQRRFHSYQTEK